MSAFALRKRLLAGQTTSSPATPTESSDTNDSTQTSQIQTQDTTTPRRSKRTRLARPPSNHEDKPELVQGAPLQPDLTSEKGVPSKPSPALPIEPTPFVANNETPIEPPPILFSNFKPSKSNYQKRKDGRIHMKIIDREVCSAQAPIRIKLTL